MMNVERRHGEDKPVIRKALVELDGPVFAELVKYREEWAMNDEYVFVTNIIDGKMPWGKTAQKITKNVLRSLNLMP